MLNLLNRSLLSKTPMTDVFMSIDKTNENVINGKRRKVKSEPLESQVKSEPLESQSAVQKINLKLLVRKSHKKVLCAIADDNFVNFLLGLLPLPLGGMVKLLGGGSSLGSIDYLYQSVTDLCNGSPETLTNCKDKLLNPSIACHHACGNQILQMNVENSFALDIWKCFNCFKICAKNCGHGFGKIKLRLVNPKCGSTAIGNGGGFVKKSAMFMVKDDLIVEPLSSISTITLVKNLGVPLKDLEERSVTLGEQEVSSQIAFTL